MFDNSKELAEICLKEEMLKALEIGLEEHGSEITVEQYRNRFVVHEGLPSVDLSDSEVVNKRLSLCYKHLIDKVTSDSADISKVIITEAKVEESEVFVGSAIKISILVI